MVFWLYAVHQAKFLQMGADGLITILGWPYFLGLALVIAGFSYELTRTPLRSIRLLALVIALAIIMYGTACVIEPIAEIVDAWVHAGFIQYVVQHGQPLNNYDARFSWPGGFSLGAVLVAFTGQSNALGFLRWFPLAVELGYLAPLLVIARCSGVNRRAAWLGVALYYATNWIFQDYFSPQALNYLFYLTVIASVLAGWRPVRRAVTRHARSSRYSLAAWRERVALSRETLRLARLEGHDATTDWDNRVTLAVLALLGLICLASSMSHQLTPYALILALAACLATRRLGRPELVIVVAILAVGWLSLGASNYWIGHLSTIFGSAGQLSSTIGSNVTSRVTGSANHISIVKLRILITAGAYFLAGVGFLRRRTDSRVLEALAGAPFILVLAQNYGGEGLLRVVLFGLPFVSLLAASAIIPTNAGQIRALVPNARPGYFTRWALFLMVTIVLLGFCVVTTAVRGGNDAYEAFSLGELDAVNYVYAHIKPGQTIGMVVPYLPINQRYVGSVITYSSSEGSSTPTLKQEAANLIKAKPAFIILSQSQEAWGELLAGYPKGWEFTTEVSLEQKGYRIIAAWTTATVLKAPANTQTT